MKIVIALVTLLSLCGSASAQRTSATIDHVALFVRNVDSSSAFYSRLFGFEVIPNPFPGLRVVWLQIGDRIQLHMVEGLKAPVDAPFMTHTCFSVSSLDEFSKKLDGAKIPYYSGGDKQRGVKHRSDGVDQIFINDPDNYWVEINNAKH